MEIKTGQGFTSISDPPAYKVSWSRIPDDDDWPTRPKGLNARDRLGRLPTYKQLRDVACHVYWWRAGLMESPLEVRTLYVPNRIRTLSQALQNLNPKLMFRVVRSRR